MENQSLFAALAVLLGTLLVLLLKCRAVLTPFLVCILFFIAEVFLAIWPAMAPDVYGRTKIGSFEPQTALMLFLGSAGMLLASLAIRGSAVYALPGFVLETAFPRRLLIAVFLGFTFISFAHSFARLGMPPLMFMAQSEAARYEEAYAGFITFLGRGSSRCLAYWLLMEVAIWPGALSDFARRHRSLAMATAISVVITTLDGQRNILVVLCAAAMFLAALRGKLGIKRIIGIAAVVGLLFVLIGNYRMGSRDMRGYLASPSEVPILGHAQAWAVTYLEPNLHNLNNAVCLISQPANGGIFLSQLIPNFVFTLFADVPPSAVEQLRDAKLFADPGLMFRTAYADWYADFGMLGAILAVVITYALGVWAFNRARSSPIAMLLYLQMSAVVMFLPLMNFFVGIPMMLPLSLFYLLRFRPASGRVRPMHENRGNSYSGLSPRLTGLHPRPRGRRRPGRS